MKYMLKNPNIFWNNNFEIYYIKETFYVQIFFNFDLIHLVKEDEALFVVNKLGTYKLKDFDSFFKLLIKKFFKSLSYSSNKIRSIISNSIFCLVIGEKNFENMDDLKSVFDNDLYNLCEKKDLEKNKINLLKYSLTFEKELSNKKDIFLQNYNLKIKQKLENTNIKNYKNYNLSIKQKKILKIKSGHQRIRGVAGSGKTTILINKVCQNLLENKKTLVLTYNKSLINQISQQIKRTLKEKFEIDLENVINNLFVTNYHKFSKDIIDASGIEFQYEDNEDFYINKYPDYLRQGFELLAGVWKNNQGMIDQRLWKDCSILFDSILIDEGQDFYYKWYEVLNNFLSDNDEIFVFCDKKQNIYGRKLKWLDKRYKNKNLDKFGDWIDLTKNFRADDFLTFFSEYFVSKMGLIDDIKSDDIIIDLEKDFDKYLQWYDIGMKPVYKYIIDYVKNNDDINIVILIPNKYIGDRLYYLLKDLYDVDYMLKDYDKKYNNKKITVSTIHSFKGLEANNVVMYIPSYFKGKLEEFDRLIYTGITRARNNLIVFNGNSRYFGLLDGIKKDRS